MVGRITNRMGPVDQQLFSRELVEENSFRLQAIGVIGGAVNLALGLFLTIPRSPEFRARMAWVLAGFAYVALAEVGKRRETSTARREALFAAGAAASLVFSLQVTFVASMSDPTLVHVINIMLTGTVFVLTPAKLVLVYGPSTLYLAAAVAASSGTPPLGTNNLVNIAVVQVFMVGVSIIRWRERLAKFLILRELSDRADTDGLTGLANRRKLDAGIEAMGSIARRERLGTAVMMIDVDDFKLYNDTYGHLSGDKVLRKVADSLKAVCRRPSDLLGRYGGEEFLVALAGIDREDARRVAQRALEAVRALAEDFPGSAAGKLSVSVGVAWSVMDKETPILDLVARADSALYAAKQAGKDRVELV